MRDIRTTSSEIKWSELVYVQRDVENKDQFAENWDRIFGKKNKEQSNANNENNNAGTQQETGL